MRIVLIRTMFLSHGVYQYASRHISMHMVRISTHLVLVCNTSYMMYSKTVQPQSHQKTCALFLWFTTIGVLLQQNILCILYWYVPCLSVMVHISTHLVISVRTWCVSVCISSWCVILHIMYSKTVQPQSHQKTRALFLLEKLANRITFGGVSFVV